MWHGISALLLVQFFLMGSAIADIPQVISYQGKVTDTGGMPVADGTYTMQFRIYDDPSGGTLLWDDTHPSVQVTDGIFSVMLGESPLDPIELAFDQDYWLLVTIAGDDQTPRQRLGSVGYSFMASGLIPGTEISGEVTTGTEAAIKGVNTATTSGFVDGGRFESGGPQGRGVYGIAYSTVGINYGVVGASGSTSGRGVYGWTWATTGTTYGVRGTTYSPDGYGIYGYGHASTGNSYGVYGKTDSPSGYAGYFEGVVHASSAASTGYATTILGVNTSSANYTSGVRGDVLSTAGYGVFGWAGATSGSSRGVYGLGSSPSGVGVLGWAYASSGTNYGVHGTTNSPSGYGVYGSSPGGYGVYGQSASANGTGVFGEAPGYGVYGQSASANGTGVYGRATAGTGNAYGVYGNSGSTTGSGVYGYAWASTGVNYGARAVSFSTSGRGVYGWAWASTGANNGVRGETNSPSGYGVYYVGGLGGTGLMNSVVMTSQGPTALDVHTTAGNWVEDFGEARLVDGRAQVELDPVFLETVTIDATNPMQVFLQAYHNSCAGLVVERDETRFDVYNPLDPSASGDFGYRVVAKKKGFEGRRLDVCEAARTDPYLYPELREKELEELEREQARIEKERARMDEERARAERERAHMTEVTPLPALPR